MRRAAIGIAGAGVGGLALAVALSRGGHFDVTVLERAPSALKRGAALILWTNAVKALASLGVVDAVRAVATEVTDTEFRDANGHLLCRLPVGEWSAELGAPTLVVPRAALIEILLDSLVPGVLRASSGVRRFSQLSDARVCVEFDDGSATDLDGLIGADGLRSVVRTQLLGTQAPRSLGFDAWVGIASEASDSIAAGASIAWVGNGPRFWAASLPGGRVSWYATLNHRHARDVKSREGLIEAFAGWQAPVARLIAATDAAEIIHTQIWDRPPSTRWGDGAVTLLGDAAQPITPDLGQGACQALESAVTLAACLSAKASIPEAMRRYEGARMRRSADVSRLCWLTSTNSTLEDPILCRLRDAAMRVGLRSVARRELRWLLSGQVA